MPITRLPRTILSLKGETVVEWLGGLITNSLNTDLTYAALLTPQGKIIADFFIHKHADDHLILETSEKFGKALTLRLKMYKLRAAIDITDISSSHSVYALWDGNGSEGTHDQRHWGLGQRLLTDDLLPCENSLDDYDQHRLNVGVTDSHFDFGAEQVFPLDANLDQLFGVNYKKGCFVGQEVVSRMHRKSDVRKRMKVINLTGPAAPGDTLMSGASKAGDIVHVNKSRAVALVRLNRLKDGEALSVNEQACEIKDPSMDVRRNDPGALKDFAALNIEWIRELHHVEPSDQKMVDHPEIYAQGDNSVFSIHIGGKTAGVCALKKDDQGKYELTKMAVATEFRQHGLGQTLMDIVETYARSIGLKSIYLISNTKNAAAIRLYERSGWTVSFKGPHPQYARANIGMEKKL